MSRAMAPASRIFQKLLRVTPLPTVLMAVPIGAGLASVGAPCTVRTRAKSTQSSSASTCAKPEFAPWPMSEDPMVKVMLSSLPTASQVLTCVLVAASAAPKRENVGRNRPSTSALPEALRKLRREGDAG